MLNARHDACFARAIMSYEHTLIYQKSIELNRRVAAITRQIPRGNATLIDQLKRAAVSVPSNFAEGCRRRTPADRRHFFDVSAASAAEVAALADVTNEYHPLTAEELDELKGVVGHLSAMLRKWR